MTLGTEDILLIDTTDTIPTTQSEVHLSLDTKQQPVNRPSAPSELTAHRCSNTAVQLQWQPSVIINNTGQWHSSTILGE